MYEVQISDNLFRRSPQIPGLISKKLPSVHKQLSTKPHNGSNIKKLRGWKELYRFRIRDYRVIYRIVQTPPTVTLLAIGHRKDVYDRLGHDPNREEPCVRVISSEHAGRLLEEQPVRDVQTNGNSRHPQSEPAGVDLLLPDRFGLILDNLEITPDERVALLACNTESELLNCEVPATLLQRILDALWPNSIDRIIDAPKRVVDLPEGLKAAVDGTRPRESYMLALDYEQKRVVKLFSDRRRARGPRIVKGGPGTGKSIVALYCVRSLIHPEQPVLSLELSEPLRILFTTYTKALVKVSTQLLPRLRC